MSFAKILRLDARTLTWVSIAILVVATMLPALLNNNQAQAAQLPSRAATLSDSVAGATDVEMEIEFEIATTGVVDSLAIQYCDDSPIIGDATCTLARSFDWAEGTLVLSNQNGTNSSGTAGTSGVVDWAIEAATDADGLVLSSAAGASLTAGDVVTFTIGGAGAADGVTNPTGDNSAFYLRIHTYDDITTMPCTVGATCDTGSDFDFDNSSLVNIDDGGLALSTASQITINARVQERLTFCVGTADPTANCGGVSGSTIDLGVLDDVTINKASNAADGPGTEAAYLQITTNAANGAIISYFGDDLKVSGATCGTVNDDGGGGSVVDQCLNYDDDPDAGTLTGPLAAGTEMWGFGVISIDDDASGVTANLEATGAYDVDAANEFAFDSNTTVEIANTTDKGGSTFVAASEQLTLDFGATAQITTPTGLYSTTLTFIATSTF